MEMYNLCPATGASVILLIMLRKGSELLKGDREVLLDLDYGGEAQTTDSYGSLQNGSFIPPRYVRTVLLFSPQRCSMFSFLCRNYIDVENNCTFTQQPQPCCFFSTLHTSLTFLRWCSESDIHRSTLWYHGENQKMSCGETLLQCAEKFSSIIWEKAEWRFSGSSFWTHYWNVKAFMVLSNGSGFYSLTSSKGN